MKIRGHVEVDFSALPNIVDFTRARGDEALDLSREAVALPE